MSEEETLVCMIEIPRGQRNKYEWDEDLGGIVLDRFLFSSVSYPTDYGFIRDTRGADGDPLDAMVLLSEPTFPGCLIRARPVAMLAMVDEGEADDKIVCVPLKDPNWSKVESLEDIPRQLQEEIRHFFSIYKQPEGKKVEVFGWESKERALEVLEEARRRLAVESSNGSAPAGL